MFSMIKALSVLSGGFSFWLKAHVRSERGQDLIEYALLGGLIAGALLAAAVLTGTTTAVPGMATGIGECNDSAATDSQP
jgi:Flp pilus assembly pilin Flp